MKKLILTVICVVMVAGAAQAIDYNWVSTNTTSTGTMGDYTNPLSWDNGLAVPSTARDRAIMNVSGSVVDFTMGGSSAETFTVGEFDLRSGSLYTWTRPMTFNISASAGLSGSWWSSSTANGGAYQQPASTWNIDGNFYNANAANFNGTNYFGPFTINMNGDGKAMHWSWSGSSADTRAIFININGIGIWDNNSSASPSSCGQTVTVALGKSIGSSATVAGNWAARQFIFKGGQSNLPALKSNVNFIYGCLLTDNGPLTKNFLAVAGGVVYPQDVTVGPIYWGSAVSLNPNYSWRMKGGDLTVGRNFAFNDATGASAGGKFYFSTEENATNGATYRNVNVLNNMTVGGASTTQGFLFRLNSSTLTVGGSLTVGSSNTNNSGAMDLGSGTVKLGGSLTVYQPSTWSAANWTAGTSTLICNGNGTAYHLAQTLQTWGECGTTLNNVIVNNFGGTVQLFNGVGGALRLSGNFEVDNGTFTGNKRPIMFNGPSHTITNYVNPSSYQFDDNINLLTNTTVLALGSDITIKPGDNLTMASGSIIYLCGHVLKDEGKTYDGSLWGTVWTNTEGTGSTIYALTNVPEPATLATFATAALAVLTRFRRRRIA